MFKLFLPVLLFGLGIQSHATLSTTSLSTVNLIPPTTYKCPAQARIFYMQVQPVTGYQNVTRNNFDQPIQSMSFDLQKRQITCIYSGGLPIYQISNVIGGSCVAVAGSNNTMTCR